MSKFKPIYSLISFGLLATGFLFSFWPLSLLGVIVAAAAGQYVASIVIGLILDIMYGAPPGLLHSLYVPFTLLAFILSTLHFYLSAYFREGSRDTL